MKAIQFSGVITSIRGKVDKSVGLSISTPELSTEQKAMFFELQGVESEIFVAPKDMVAEEYKVDKDLETKTPSRRQRDIIYVIFKKQLESGKIDDDFNIFYKDMMNRIAEGLKIKYLDNYAS